MHFNDHQEKYKTDDVRGIHGEQFRELKTYKNNVNPERTHLNQIYIFNPELDSGNWAKRINQCKKIHKNTTGKALRKDAVVFISDVATVPKEWPTQTALEYFDQRNDFMVEFLSEHGVDREYFLSSAIHMDEDEPHQTIVYMPFKDGRFQAKNIMNKVMLKQLQKEGWKFYKQFESQHPEIGSYKLDPYVEGNTDIKSKKRHKEELQYKIDKDKEKLKDLNTEISEKQNELDSINDAIITNPVTKLTDDTDLKRVIQEVKDNIKAEEIRADTDSNLNHSKESIPRFNDKWLEENIEVVEPKIDLFGREKEPGYIKISAEEWEKKKSHKSSDNKAFHKLENMFRSIESKYNSIVDQYQITLTKLTARIKSIENTLSKLIRLPIVSKWSEIEKNEQMIPELVKELQLSDIQKDSLTTDLSHERWYHRFYDNVLVFLAKSKISDGRNTLDVVLSGYDDQDRKRINDDLKSIQSQYKEIVYYKGTCGYGWYASRIEGGAYLGKKADLKFLKEVYPKAIFRDPYGHIDIKGIYR